jgi:hypothetical protein
MKNLKIKEIFNGLCCKTVEVQSVIKPGNYNNYKVIEIVDIPPNISSSQVIHKYNATAVANNIYKINYKSLGNNKIVSY